jgi:hypothetical protein
MIFLSSRAGLCNRLRALDSSILLGRRLKQRVAVWWESNAACAAEFLELFEPVPEVKIQWGIADGVVRAAFSERSSLSLLRNWVHFDEWGEKLKGKLDALFYGNREPLRRHVIEALSQKHAICIRSDAGWFYPEDFRWLVPKRDSQEKIARMNSRFSAKTVGVHIRRGDHAEAIANNPLDGFLSAMSGRLCNDPTTSFFLSTEDSETRTKVREVIGSSVFAYDHDTSRSTLDGMKAAVVDLFCLANCSEIWGTSGSSFSETAHHLRKSPISYPARDFVSG